MREQNKRIEEACAAMAAAMAQLVAAVQGPTAPGAISASMKSKTPGPTTPRLVTKGVFETVETNGGAKPGRRVHVYLAGSRGCASLAETYGPQIMAALGIDRPPYIVKCGTTVLDLADRLRQIGRDGYGAAVRMADGIAVEPGFSSWIAHAISTAREPRDPAVRLMPRAIAVDLPAGLTRRGFDAALHRALEGRSLESVPASVVPRRLVAYDLVEIRVNAAKELYALSPHDSDDGDLLLDAIEDILCRFRAKRA